MKIAIASDHAGYEEKERMKPLLDELGIQYEDLGTVSEESVDYPTMRARWLKRWRKATSNRVCCFVARHGHGNRR